MYDYIRGKLVQACPAWVVVEAGGVGYKLFIPPNFYTRLPPLGETAQIHTSFVVRELSHTLFGFESGNHRDFFEALMGVTGIGPKIALSLIGHMPLDELHHTIAQGNIIALSRVPGIGKKTAERLVMEMRDKIPALMLPDPSGLSVKLQSDPQSQKIVDAMSALIHLGYNQINAQKAIKKSLGDLPETTALADLITHALKHL